MTSSRFNQKILDSHNGGCFSQASFDHRGTSCGPFRATFAILIPMALEGSCPLDDRHRVRNDLRSYHFQDPYRVSIKKL